MSFITIVLLLFSVLTASTAQIFFKKSILSFGEFDFSFSNIINLVPQALKNPWFLGGIVLFVISFLSYILVLSKMQLNVAYPIMVSAGIVLISLASWFILKEPYSQAQLIGIAVIVLGIILLLSKK